jgi:hypothetical protein
VQLVDTDKGDLIGRWRAADGLVLTTMMADQRGGMTFAAAKGCAIAQGLLSRREDDFAVRLYDNLGFAFDGCSRTSDKAPVLAPFNGRTLRLERSGTTLTALGDGATRVLQRDKLADLQVAPRSLHGRWLLARGGQALPPDEGAVLTLTDGHFRLQSACGWEDGDGWLTFPGLAIRMAGRFRTSSTSACAGRTVGDRLLAEDRSLELRFDPASTRLVVTSTGRNEAFVRG